MDNPSNEDEDGVQSERIRDGFLCCVCLELLYKPIVLACGHVACFWCVNRSMSGFRKSRCPLCRHQYYHFPSICQMLHVLLMKMYPLTYKKRESQILEYEKEHDIFSPQFENYVLASSPKHKNSCAIWQGKTSASGSKDTLFLDSSTLKNIGMEKVESLVVSQHSEGTEVVASAADSDVCSTYVKSNKSDQENSDTTNGRVSIADVLCAVCQQLLFQPVVLNCGHACCKTCIGIEANKAFKCRVCQFPHPGEFRKVFLELDNLLEENFSKEYAQRKITQPKLAEQQPEMSTSGVSEDVTEDGQSSSLPYFEVGCPGTSDDVGMILPHFGVGCDVCGLYPINGDRYKCLDCMEFIGFDLCEECYKNRSMLPGRFNQQHTPEHRFKLMPSMKVSVRDRDRSLFLQLYRGESGFALFAPENDFHSPSNEGENSEDASAVLVDSIENDDEDQSPM